MPIEDASERLMEKFKSLTTLEVAAAYGYVLLPLTSSRVYEVRNWQWLVCERERLRSQLMRYLDVLN